MTAEPGVELENELIALDLLLIEPRIAQHMRRGDDRVHSIGFGSATKRDRLVPVARTIIDPRQTVEVNINQE